jgi:rubrerythrin
VNLLCPSEMELIEFFKEQIKLEEQIVKSINTSLKALPNPIVKGVLGGIALDSSKHAQIYRAAIELTSFPPALSEDEFNQLKTVVKKHIEDEDKAIDSLKSAIKKTKSEKIKFLLKSIASDEKKHHELLHKIMDIVVKGETITESDWWEFLWRNVPFHGAPGG